ncbi:MAG: T9SS type A sorting domain-containing protein [Bacteroidota bacterium]|nr:T9SS type A sorting domain-containing protein [Bacteroidota bacterium]
MKKLYFFTFLSLFISKTYSQQAFWTETFGTGCNSGQAATVVATPTNGAWAITSFSLPFMNGPDANQWFISSSEQGQPVGICGGITCGGPNNRTLHIGRNVLLPTPVVDVGASYYGGPISYTNKRVETPVIDCSGKKFIQLSFTYILGGIPTNDYCDIEYSGDGGATWNFLVTMGQTNNSTCGLQGLWSFYNIGLPTTLSNNNNVKLGFHWYSNDPTGGSPSVAIDEIRLSELTITTSSNVDCLTANSTASINNVAIGNTSYTWAVTPATATLTPITGTAISMQFPGMGTYTLNAYGSGLPSGAATSTAERIVTVGFVTTPMVSAVSTDSILCTGNSAVLTASGATTYTWNTSANTSTINISPTANTTYTVTGKNGYCVSSFTILQTVDPCTSLFEANKIEVAAIFPNPFSNKLNFISNGEMEVCIRNMVGETIKQALIHSTGTINTSEFSSGIYFVTIKTEKETKVLKLMRD